MAGTDLLEKVDLVAAQDQAQVAHVFALAELQEDRQPPVLEPDRQRGVGHVAEHVDF
ncbi:hypothetical protein D3C73_1485120 [compost metagenome]